jgi:ParB family chromosome partitioning protein
MSAGDAVMKLMLDEIDVRASHRPIHEDCVDKLSRSIRQIGLQHPITVVRGDSSRFVLVAGRHRLEAVRKLGLDRISAQVVKMTDDEARMWEISENLHRAELTALERAEQISEYAALAKKIREGGQVGHPDKRYEERGASVAAKDLGVSRGAVRRAETVASLPQEAKDAAVKMGVSDNQSALLRVAREPTADAQLAAIRRERDLVEARKINRCANEAIALTEAQRFAEWLHERTHESEVPQLISWIEGCRPKDVIRALRREAA